jgi:sirohydrochlorin ferrochelatase
MTGFLEDNMLRFEGLDDQDIAALNAALPDIQELDAALAAQWPRIVRVVPVLLRIANKIIAKQKELKS